MIPEVSKILTAILGEGRDLEAKNTVTLFRTLHRIWFSARRDGCFFRTDDEAFNVPELRASLQFAQMYKKELGMIGGYAVIDYWLPKPYINAAYVPLDEQEVSEDELRRYAGRLTALYKDKEVESIIFDSNKVMTHRQHYSTFALSRKKGQHQWDEFDDEYLIDINDIQEEFNDAMPDEFGRLLEAEGDDFIVALSHFYNRVTKKSRKWIEDRLKSCSPMVEKGIPNKAMEVNGVWFDDPQSAFLTYLAFFISINSPSAQEFMYFPVQMVAGPDKTLRWIGGMLLPFCDPPSRAQRADITAALQLLIPNFYSSYMEGLLLESLEKTAQAQIMSRNMSHNLGSHALARIKGSDMKSAPGDSERLLGYLQERMDFVARVATEWPTWREPVLFYGDLVRGFLKQGLLLDNLVADDGYRAEQIEFYVVLPGREGAQEAIRLTFVRGGEDGSFSEFRETAADAGSGKANSDVLVAIPGGPVGRQAFYGFLENAIRNAAKHNSGRCPLKVFLKLEEATDEEGRSTFYVLSYQDSISAISLEQLKSVKKHLRQGLVDEKSRHPVSEAWGIQEMKVYAKYIAYPFQDMSRVVPGLREQQFLAACRQPFMNPRLALRAPALQPDGAAAPGPAQSDVREGNEVLTYAFGLQRPSLALVVGKLDVTIDRQLGSLYGLEFLDEGDHNLALESLPRQRPGLLYLALDIDESNVDELLDLLKQSRLALPARVLIWAGRFDASLLRAKLREKWLSHHVRVDDDKAPFVWTTVDSLGDAEQMQLCVVDLYRRWLSAVAHERGFETPFNVILYFDRDGYLYPQRWADLGESVRKFKLTERVGGKEEELINVFPVAKEVSGEEPAHGRKEIFLSNPYAVTTFPWYEEVGFTDRLKVDKKWDKRPKTWLVFDNHGVANVGGAYQHFHQYVGAYSKDEAELPNNREAFDRLTNVPQGFVGVLSLIQLVEASLLKVLVLDERVAGAVLDLTPPGGETPGRKLRWRASGNNSQYGRELAGSFSKAGISFASFFKFELEGRETELCVLRSDEKVVNELRSRPLGVIEIQDGRAVSYKEPNRADLGGTRAGEAVSREGRSLARDGRSFDAVIIHKGLLEWLDASLSRLGVPFEQETFLKSLHNLGGRVILTSGRGAQMEGPLAEYPFVEFAVLESYIVRELSKPSLGNVLMSVSNQGAGDGPYQRTGYPSEQAHGAGA